MPKKRDIGTEILEGLRELKEGRHGRVVNVPDVGKVREKTGLSQPRFAELLGISVRTVTVHVSNLLRKTRSASRTEVALWAVRNQS